MYVFEVYRRRKDSSEWHFHTQCPDWPETDYIQTGFLEPDECDRLCPECKRLEGENVSAAGAVRSAN